MEQKGKEDRFTGQMLPGRGRAGAQLAEMAAEMDRTTGETLFPGSLNVILDRPLMLDESAAHLFDGGKRMMWRATLNNEPVWIYRWRNAPLHVAEILSTVRLRDRLALQDGDTVVVALPRASVGKINLLGLLVWSACWIGRRQWCYTRDAYYLRTASHCRRWGATQA